MLMSIIIVTILRTIDLLLLFVPFTYSFMFGLKTGLKGIPRLLVGAATIYLLGVIALTYWLRQPFDFPLSEVLPRTLILAMFYVLIGVPLMYIGAAIKRIRLE